MASFSLTETWKTIALPRVSAQAAKALTAAEAAVQSTAGGRVGGVLNCGAPHAQQASSGR